MLDDVRGVRGYPDDEFLWYLYVGTIESRARSVIQQDLAFPLDLLLRRKDKKEDQHIINKTLYCNELDSTRERLHFKI